MNALINQPVKQSEFEMQAELYFCLKKLGFDVRGEVTSLFDGERSFFDLVIFHGHHGEIRTLIDNLKPLINSAGDAVIIVPLIKDYLDVSVKNDDLLIKMAGIVQRAMNSNQGSDELLLSDSDTILLLSGY